MLLAFTNARIFTGTETINGKALIVRDNKIDSLTELSHIPSGCEIIDCDGNYLTAGFIDLQIAGAGGYLFSAEPTPEALKAITSAIVRTGTTGFLIAIPTNSNEVYRQVIKTAGENPNQALLGLHIEGPFLNPLRRGAHIKEYIRTPVPEDVKNLVSLGREAIGMMTIAPEVCSREIIEFLNESGIVIAAGHSNATFREGVEGFRNGVRTTTHLFNAMSQLHHRDPGLPGAVFQTPGVFASIIADGIHVDYSMVSIAKKLLNDRLFLISDAVEENRREAYLHIRKEDRFTLPDGTLSGSALTMMKAVENCVKNVSIPLEEALRMATLYPARVMGISGRGRIEAGCRADLVAFDDEFNVQKVCLNGSMV
ncbi:MAG: N-acetylglucosamine-6-phosphate deacetylase [Bacteroidales bacterium]|jgi:N-acetylglucosamine-6-phosphate deacetylase|nr:N-acetylglucosamine-6-phosphate deacetylase [Bacteroidales bacterium]